MFQAAVVQSVIPIASAVVAGIITAIVSVQLALRRFRRERAWEEKFRAYRDLFTALHHAHGYCLIRLREIEEGAQFEQTFRQNIDAQAQAGFAEIRKAVAIGTFVFGEKVAIRLEELERQIANPRYNEDPHEIVSNDLASIATALRELKLLAKRDLSLPK